MAIGTSWNILEHRGRSWSVEHFTETTPPTRRHVQELQLFQGDLLTGEIDLTLQWPRQTLPIGEVGGCDERMVHEKVRLCCFLFFSVLISSLLASLSFFLSSFLSFFLSFSLLSQLTYLSIYLSACLSIYEIDITSKTKQICKTSFQNEKFSAEVTASYQCVLWSFHSICLKYCDCQEKVRPGRTKCGPCHAKSS